MNLVKASVYQSTIEGLGLFADELIPAGTTVWKFHNNIDILFGVPWEASNMQEILTANGFGLNECIVEEFKKYSFIKERTLLYPCDSAKYTNHSDDPNTIGNMFLRTAIRDIQVGEEITCNYKDLIDGFKGF